MQFTFGIITNGSNINHLRTTVASILAQSNMSPEDFEIIIVGNIEPVEHPNIRFIVFDEQERAGWITRKKNIIAQEAKFENIVFMHDYVMLESYWYDGWKEYGNDFEIAVNKIFTHEGYRHSDWVLNMYDLWEVCPELKDTWDVALPYDIKGLTSLMYISGGFWVAKKDFSLRFPQNESLGHNDAEDINWCNTIRHHTTFKFNEHSSCRLQKPNKWAPKVIDMEYLKKYCEIKKVELK